ncbi:unnamed protein product [Lupinus luteus]|uniref:Defensin-like protein n=1 Tax=Lupinus luteus TaxID=3873 RepID=A0AAV1WBD2_LUPLU
MANHMLNYWQFFRIIVLMVAAWNMVQIIADQSSQPHPLGACGRLEECDQKCKAKYPGGGQGSCNLGLCNCYYYTEIPPSKNYCTGVDGLCALGCGQECCNEKCDNKYFKSKGYCSPAGSYTTCLCQYVC